MDSLELWVSLTWLASHTNRISFGPLVTPVSFRHPTLTARMAAAVDDLSLGRLVLGVGAGWQEREHANYGWELLDTQGRFARLNEGLEVISRLLHSEQAFDYTGSYFQLKEAILLPRPARKGGPPILVGGNGEKHTLPLAARYADEWNAVYVTPERFKELSGRLDALILAEGRQPQQVRRSLMTGCVFGRNQADLIKKVEARAQGKLSAQELRQRGLLVGTAGDFLEQLAALDRAGVQQVMLQWLDLEDMEGLEALARDVLQKMG
jgi:alkanesulfonate monooxygenase SsuD/methylene tetrahydromethanopterin reductase-like flavin-dependent oxidoreductase (luciferase family)